jgi:phosphoglycolate phosphatase-like HAD superfamily hydrolase
MESVDVQSVSQVLVAGDTPNDLRAGANAGVKVRRRRPDRGARRRDTKQGTPHPHPGERRNHSRVFGLDQSVTQ